MQAAQSQRACRWNRVGLDAPRFLPVSQASAWTQCFDVLAQGRRACLPPVRQLVLLTAPSGRPSNLIWSCYWGANLLLSARFSRGRETGEVEEWWRLAAAGISPAPQPSRSRASAIRTAALPRGCGVNRRAAQGLKTQRLAAQKAGAQEALLFQLQEALWVQSTQRAV